MTVSLVALLCSSACVRYPWLRIPSLLQDHSNVLFPNLESCSKGSGHLNNPLYNLGGLRGSGENWRSVSIEHARYKTEPLNLPVTYEASDEQRHQLSVLETPQIVDEIG